MAITNRNYPVGVAPYTGTDTAADGTVVSLLDHVDRQQTTIAGHEATIARNCAENGALRKSNRNRLIGACVLGLILLFALTGNVVQFANRPDSSVAERALADVQKDKDQLSVKVTDLQLKLGDQTLAANTAKGQLETVGKSLTEAQQQLSSRPTQSQLDAANKVADKLQADKDDLQKRLSEVKISPPSVVVNPAPVVVNPTASAPTEASDIRIRDTIVLDSVVPATTGPDDWRAAYLHFKEAAEVDARSHPKFKDTILAAINLYQKVLDGTKLQEGERRELERQAEVKDKEGKAETAKYIRAGLADNASRT
jgi:hypothetical protein